MTSAINTSTIRFPAMLGFAALLICSGCGDQAPQVDAKAELAAGVELSLRYSFDAAESRFAKARAASAPSSEGWLQATLGLAVALHHRVPLSAERIVGQAAPLYEEVVNKGGQSLLAARAAINRGRIAEQRDDSSDQIDAVTAIRWYQLVIDGWPDLPIAGEATLRLAACRIQCLDPAEVTAGIRLAETRAEAYPSELWAASLWHLAGEAWWVQLRNHKESLRCLLRAEAAGLPDRSNAWSTAWRIAALAELDGRRQVAIDHYLRVVTDFTSSGKSFEAQQRLIALGVAPPAIRPPLNLSDEGSAP